MNYAKVFAEAWAKLTVFSKQVRDFTNRKTTLEEDCPKQRNDCCFYSVFYDGL